MSQISLIHGDCLEKMKDIPDNSIDMVLTDPPYGTTACKWDNVIPFEPMWEQLKRITKDNGAICLFGSEPFSSALRMSNVKMFKYDWVWNKVLGTGHLNAKIIPLKKHEIISVFSSGNYKGMTYNRQMERRLKKRISKGSGKTYGDNEDSAFGKRVAIGGEYDYRNPTTILKFSNANRKDSLHPTQKPVPLLEYLIKTYTLENETVLDFTAGSGSTGVACSNLNRSFIGIELDETYFKIAKERITNATTNNNQSNQ